MQLALTATANYCKENKLKVNTSKSKIVRSDGKLENILFLISMEHQYSVLVNIINYMGIIFKYNIKFGSEPLDIQLKLFDKIVESTLLYGCEIWSFSNIEKIEIFQFIFKTLS